MTQQAILTACKKGSESWQQAFNTQNAKGCAQQYIDTCTMHARPVGTFSGAAAIEAFWQDIMDKGLKDVVYSDVQWEPALEDGYILTAKWQMNHAFGVVHKEHWVMQSDGLARLVHDDFEIQGER